MNILITTETYLPYISGVAVSTDSIARFMVSQGHKVTIVCPKPIIKKSLKPLKNLKVITIPSIHNPSYKNLPLTVFPFNYPYVRRAFLSSKFDIIHSQEPSSIGVSSLILAKKFKIPIVGALHFTPEQISRVLPGRPEKIVNPLVRKYIKFIYNKYDAIMVPTQTFKNFLTNDGVGRPIEVVSNGVDTKKFYPELINKSLRTKLGVSSNDCLFFFMGRLEVDKNVSTLIKALPFVENNIKLLIVGSGKIKEQLHNLANKRGVNKKIIWIDRISDEEMVNFYHAADCFTIMSPYEVQSIVTLQAVASGLPLIAANAGALPELCHDGKNGFLVSRYNYKKLAEKMNLLAKNANLRKKFGQESRIISLPHNKKEQLKKLEDLYKKLAYAV